MSGLPIAFLHGWGGSFASSFEAHGWTAAPAIAGRTVIGVNLPGHADMAASTDPESYADLTALVVAQLPDSPLDIIGYSLGAKLALALAILRPQLVHKMAIFGVGDNLFAPEPAADAIIAALEKGITTDTPPIARALAEYSRASGSNPKALAAILRRRPNPAIDANDLAAFGPRTLLINSADDKIAQPDQRLRNALPGLTYVQITGPAHIALPADPDVQRLCTNFVCGTPPHGTQEPMNTNAIDQESVRDVYS